MEEHAIAKDTDQADGAGSLGLAERRASKRGRNGFNAPRINTARFRAATPCASPTVRSPRLTIPPGINPTVLLDSPIMLFNTQELPSPTTGSYQVRAIKNESSSLDHVMPEDECSHAIEDSFFRFKSHVDHNTLQSFLSLQNQEDEITYEAMDPERPLMDSEFSANFPKGASVLKHDIASPTAVNTFDSMIVSGLSEMANNHSSVAEESAKTEDIGTQHPSEGEHRGSYPSLVMLRTSEDGYNWRKYGQKQVKGSEYPRSYYKCTHPNCQVKKKVERSFDGEITEIIYKGAHNHAKPDPNRRGMLGSAPCFDEASDVGEGSRYRPKVEGGLSWRNTQYGVNDVKLISDWNSVDGLEKTSPTSVVTELSDPQPNNMRKTGGVFECVGISEISSTLASHEEDDDDGGEDDHVAHGSLFISNEADDGEPEMKRRRKESCLPETNMASRAVREPRVVVQIESEVDILDDGYRWRKYGQKVVKGNPNPRSYYKCTSAGCAVRKHVERASENLKCVITTYEGRHNHEVPAARNSSQLNSSNGIIQSSINNTQSTMGLSRNSTIPKSKQIQDAATHFDRKPIFNHEYQRSSIFGTFGNDMKLGAPPICHVKFPPLQNALPYSSFGLNSSHAATSLAGSMAAMVPDFPIPLPLNQNLSAAGFDFANGRSMPPFQIFLANQQQRERDRFLTPKQDSYDNIYGPFQTIDSTNVSPSSSVSSVYQQITGNFQ